MSAHRFPLAGYLYALGATALWSGNFIIARGLSDDIPPVALAFSRWSVAVLVFTPFAVKKVCQERHIVKKHLPYFAVTALLGITTFNTLIYIAGHTTEAVNLSLIAITFPIFILVFSRILYNEPLTLKKGLGVVLVLLGVVYLITKGSISVLLQIRFNRGDLWMLSAAVIFAAYSLFLKNRPKGISVYTMQLTTMTIGLVFLLPFFLWEQSGIVTDFINAQTLPGILYAGIFASLFAFILWSNAVSLIGPSKAGMIYYTLPVFSAVEASLFLGESFGLVHLLAMILILSGIFITSHERQT